MYRLLIERECLNTMSHCQLHNPNFLIEIFLQKGNIWKLVSCYYFTQIGVSSLYKLKVEELKAKQWKSSLNLLHLN